VEREREEERREERESNMGYLCDRIRGCLLALFSPSGLTSQMTSRTTELDKGREGGDLDSTIGCSNCSSVPWIIHLCNFKTKCGF